MTTIACDGLSMAGDGLVTAGGLVHSRDLQKVHLLRDGRVAGFTGCVFLIEAGLAFLNGDADELDVGDDFEALILHHNGRVLCMDGKGRTYSQSVPCAAGSGCGVAVAAMMFGKTPREAVELACLLDTSTGGTILSLRPEKRAAGLPAEA